MTEILATNSEVVVIIEENDESTTIAQTQEVTIIVEMEPGVPGADGVSGADGADGADGKSAYQSYLDTTTDDPVKSEEEWASLQVDHVHDIADVTGLQEELDAKATPTDVQTAIDNLINGAGSALDTLNELANALGNDADFATNITNLINEKFTLPSLTSGSVLFSDGTTISQNNNQFFWDRINSRLGIGSKTIPNDYGGAKLYVRETGSSTGSWKGRIANGGDNVAFLMGEYNSQAWLGAHNAGLSAWADMYIQQGGTVKTFIGVNSSTPILTTDNATARVGVNTISPFSSFDVNAGNATYPNAFNLYGSGIGVFGRISNTNTAGYSLFAFGQTNNDVATPAWIARYGSTHATRPNEMEVATGGLHRLSLSTNSIRRIIIDGDGRTAVGGTPDINIASVFQVTGTGATGPQVPVLSLINTTDNTSGKNLGIITRSRMSSRYLQTYQTGGQNDNSFANPGLINWVALEYTNNIYSALVAPTEFRGWNYQYWTGTTYAQLLRIGIAGVGIALPTISDNPTACLDVAASTTARASLRIRTGVAPTAPNDGDIWQDGTDLKIRIGGVTKTFTLV